MAMFRLLRGWLTTAGEPPSGLSQLVGQHLSHLPADRVELAVAYAGLLVRVAHADSHLSAEERSALPELIARLAGVEQGDARAIAELVLQQVEGLAGIQYSSLTEAFNQLAT